MIDMAVADDQRVQLGRIDLEQADIVDDRGRRVAEIQQDIASLLFALRFQKQRQTPLIVQDVARVGAAAAARTFVNDAVHGTAAQKLVVLLIDQHADRQFVDGRHLDRNGAGNAHA